VIAILRPTKGAPKCHPSSLPGEEGITVAMTAVTGKM
jgi:hypothetical protein